MNNGLISRGALDGMKLFVAPGEKPDKETIGWNRAIDYVIKTAPAADAEAVRHGRWISDYSSIICSECRAEYSDEINCMNRDFKFDGLNYCPNCGAKMDAEVQDATKQH